MPALPEPEDATKNKISEARYFLHLIKERRDAYLSGEGDNERCLRLFKYFLSAFLCSARSILDYMKEQYKLEGTTIYNKFVSGYMQRNNKFRELKFFDKCRVENVHFEYENKEPFKVKQRDQYTIPLTCYLMLEGSVVEEPTSKPILKQKAHDQQSSTKETQQPRRVPIELLFLKHEGFLDRDTEVIEFCTKQLDTMIGLVGYVKKAILL